MPKTIYKHPDRRTVLKTALAAGGSLLVGGCQPLSEQPWARKTLSSAEWLTYRAQRLLLSADALAREYSDTDISPWFKPNGTSDPSDSDYQALARNGFADYRLVVDGLVEQPARLSLRDLRALPPRTQITRHDCVEGWSCIGKWTGAPLSEILQIVRPGPRARFVVFHCADTMESGASGDVKYYESIDFADALHPQTILAYEMNGGELGIPYGAPLRLRVERQLGYKMAKYVMRIEFVDDLARLGGGQGGYWEDRGYEWYAGI